MSIEISGVESVEFYNLQRLDPPFSQERFDNLLKEGKLLMPNPVYYSSDFQSGDNDPKLSFETILKKQDKKDCSSDELIALRNKYFLSVASYISSLPKSDMYITKEQYDSVLEELSLCDSPASVVKLVNEHAVDFLSQAEIKNPDLTNYHFEISVSTDLTYSFKKSEYIAEYGYDPTEAYPDSLRSDLVSRLEKENPGRFKLDEDSFKIKEVWSDDHDPDKVFISLDNVRGSFDLNIIAVNEESLYEKVHDQVMIKDAHKFYGELFADCEAQFDEIARHRIETRFNEQNNSNGLLKYDLDLRMSQTMQDRCEMLLEKACLSLRNGKIFNDFQDDLYEDFFLSDKNSLFEQSSLEYLNLRLPEINQTSPFCVKLEQTVASCFEVVFDDVLNKNFRKLAANALISDFEDLKYFTENSVFNDQSFNRNEDPFVKASIVQFVEKNEQSLRNESVIDSWKKHLSEHIELGAIYHYLDHSYLPEIVDKDALKEYENRHKKSLDASYQESAGFKR